MTLTTFLTLLTQIAIDATVLGITALILVIIDDWRWNRAMNDQRDNQDTASRQINQGE